MLEKSKQETARDEIDKICRNGFNPGKEVVDNLLREREARALVILKAAARAYRKIVPIH